MFGSFLLGCFLFAGAIMVDDFKRAAPAETSSAPPTNRLVNLVVVYSLPALALVLGVMGKLPGTRRETPAPPVISTPIASPVLPPPLPQAQQGAPKLSPEEIAAVLEKTIQEKFGVDRSKLGRELVDELLTCVINKHVFNLTAAQTGRPTEQDVAAFEKTIGFALPQDFRAFVMSGFGCLHLEVKETVWPRPKAGAIVPAWHLMYTLYVYGLSAEVPDFMDIRKQFSGFARGGHRMVPFLRLEGYLDQYCFTPGGGIVLWRSETRDTEPVDLTFSALLLKEIRTLQERAQQIHKEPNPYAQLSR